MRIIATAIAAAGMATASPALAQSLVGTWDATVVVEGMGEFTETLTVSESGDGYSVVGEPTGAAAAMPGAGPSPATNVTLDGDTFSFRRTIDTPQGAMEMTYSGTVEGDSFTGVVDMGFGQMAYSGVRN